MQEAYYLGLSTLATGALLQTRNKFLNNSWNTSSQLHIMRPPKFGDSFDARSIMAHGALHIVVGMYVHVCG